MSDLLPFADSQEFGVPLLTVRLYAIKVDAVTRWRTEPDKVITLVVSLDEREVECIQQVERLVA